MVSNDKSSTYARLYRFGPFRLDADERLLFQDDTLVSLPAKAFDLLLLLVEAAGHLKSREELIEALWPDTIVVENSLSWHVGTVRKILNEKEDGRHYIETVRGHGYRFSAPVKVELVAVAPPEEVEAPSVAASSVHGGIEAEADPPRQGYAGVAPRRVSDGQAVPDRSRTGRAPTEGATDGQTESIGARSLAKESPSIILPAAGGEEGKQGSRTSLLSPIPPPPGRRKILWAAGAAAIIVIAGVLIWRFVPFGGSGKLSAATPVIAVMPFENLSSDANNAYLAEGIQDTILSKLAGIGGLHVISRASTKRYPSHPANLHKIATELGATAVLEGSVQKSGDRVLINVQLINAATDEHIWAQVYTRSLADVFAVESDVATQVATSLKAKLLPGEAARLASKPTDDPQAYLLLLKANYYANQVLSNSNAKNSTAALVQAATLYHQAIARDPRFALAWARLSLLDIFRYKRSGNAKMATGGRHAAEQALALEPSLPEAGLAMAYAKYFLNGDLTGALIQLEQIPERFRDDNAEISGAIALMHLHQGNWQKALAGYRHAIMLDPRNPRWLVDIGIALTMLRHYTQATRRFNQALALEPNDYYAAAYKAVTLLAAGKSLEQIQKLVSNIPPTSTDKELVPALFYEIARLSRQPQAALDTLKDTSGWVSAPNTRGREPAALLRAQAWETMGDKKKARRSYEKARNMLQFELHGKPRNSNLWSLLGLAEAGLGQKAQAVTAGRKATSLTSASKDAIEGPSHLIILANIYARVGKPRHAIKLLRRLLEMPAGIVMSVSLLERDPVWDPLRKNSAFQKLLQEFANKPPSPVP